jgi:hypothetical protein
MHVHVYLSMHDTATCSLEIVWIWCYSVTYPDLTVYGMHMHFSIRVSMRSDQLHDVLISDSGMKLMYPMATGYKERTPD